MTAAWKNLLVSSPRQMSFSCAVQQGQEVATQLNTLLPASGHSHHCSFGREVYASLLQLDSVEINHLSPAQAFKPLIWSLPSFKENVVPGWMPAFLQGSQKGMMPGWYNLMNFQKKTMCWCKSVPFRVWKLSSLHDYLFRCWALFFSTNAVTKRPTAWRKIHRQRYLWSNKWHLLWWDEN